MNRDEEYQRQAADAENRARHASNDIDRAAWIRIAEGWLSLLHRRPQSDDLQPPKAREDDFGSSR
jgi:hypothetical protein